MLRDKDRYINPKMEEELRIFKLKIAYRFENAQIPKDFTFPRRSSNEEREDLLRMKK